MGLWSGRNGQERASTEFGDWDPLSRFRGSSAGIGMHRVDRQCVDRASPETCPYQRRPVASWMTRSASRCRVDSPACVSLTTARNCAASRSATSARRTPKSRYDRCVGRMQMAEVDNSGRSAATLASTRCKSSTVPTAKRRRRSCGRGRHQAERGGPGEGSSARGSAVDALIDASAAALR
jgi:hypothetical protein